MDFSNCQSQFEKCTIDQCSRRPRSSCKCCKQELCYQHLWKHEDLLIAQLKLLKKDIHEVNRRLQTVNVRESMSNFREHLKKWRINCYTIIDSLCDRKSEEFYEYIDMNFSQQRKNIGHIQKRIEEFIKSEDGNPQEINLIKSTVDDLSRKMDKIQKSDFPVTVLPLNIDENLIQINY
ncbi:unnamed protein product [Rotaria socialis]|uniref:Uncharacterized protein n=1 Tax=Rotaria socialis TaxID=392032 RepID=A0A820YTV7_9BILA|nr:unnamed protein product [Rotaria socialis]CAF3638590.1 unnamed protein product [Rotaria socialis]CAF4311690.1 unnamed protein product [Rotaria socialis]CAF4551217.1 unnamed protein product [Rotaria socialis]